MSPLNARKMAWKKRQIRVRKKITGTAERPRLNIFKSSQHIYAQIVDDTTGTTIVAASTVMVDVKAGLKHCGNAEAAKKVGSEIARRALEKNITQVVFDRNGFLYHGRVKALADAAREHGLSF